MPGRFGNVRTLPSGRHQARYTGPDGRQHSGPFTFNLKADAWLWLSEQELKVRRGQWVDPRAGTLTFGAYVEVWWKTKGRLAPSTRVLYEGFLSRHILPSFGRRRLNDIAPAAVKRWHTELSLGSLSRNSVAKIYRLLKEILGSALIDELIQRNPCMIPGGGTERVAERKFPATEQVLSIVEATPPRSRAFVVTAAFMGLRFGELAGLQRRHINPMHKTLKVEQQLVEVADKLQLRPPKTSAGRRTLRIPEEVLRVLEAHLTEFCQPGPDAFVFTTNEGNLVERHNFRNRVWLPACRKAGIEGFRFHDLRHHAATLAATSGVSLKALMQRLGHSSPQAALIYQHASMKDEEQIVAHIDARLTKLMASLSV